MGRIEEDLKSGQFARVYLLYGEDAYLRNYYKNRLKKALVPPDDTMNFTQFTGKDAVISELISQADTMPFFANRRVVLAENTGWFTRAQDALAEYLPKIPAETVILFSEDEVDRRQKLYKTVQKVGAVVECAHLKEKALSDWVVRRLAKEGKQIQRAAMDRFLQAAGEDLYAVSNELEKVIAYTGERTGVLISDVEAVCRPRLENHIFQMMDAISQANRQQALARYYELLGLRESPLGILAMISSQIGRMLQVKDLRDQGYDRSEIVVKTGWKEFAVSSTLRSSAAFSLDDLKLYLKRCVQTNEDIKMGRVGERIGVELLIVELSGRKKAPE